METSPNTKAEMEFGSIDKNGSQVHWFDLVTSVEIVEILQQPAGQSSLKVWILQFF